MTPWSMLLGTKYKVYRLGGAKVKSVNCAKLSEFRKMSIYHFVNFYQNFLNFFWWKIWLIRLFFHLIITFGSIFFWLGCIVRKMDDHYGLFLLSFSKLAIMLENDDWYQLSPKKIVKFWWKLKEYKPYPYPAETFAPPPHASFRVNNNYNSF